MGSVPQISVVEVVVESTRVQELDSVGIVTTTETPSTLTLANEVVTLIEVGVQGPPGPTGTGTGPQTAYDKRSDVFSDEVIYRAEAAQGSPDGAPVWRIRRITIEYGDQVTTTTAYPDGEQTFAFRWDQRTTYNYE